MSGADATGGGPAGTPPPYVPPAAPPAAPPPYVPPAGDPAPPPYVPPVPVDASPATPPLAAVTPLPTPPSFAGSGSGGSSSGGSGSGSGGAGSGGSGSGSGPNRTPVIVALVALVAVVLIAVAVVVTDGAGPGDELSGGTTTTRPTAAAGGGTGPGGGGSGGAATTTAPGATTVPAGDVTVSGMPLPTSDGGSGTPTEDPAVGFTLPTITGTDLHGDPLTIGPGDPQLIVVMAHWCPHCQAEIPRIVGWINDGVLPDGVAVNGISTAVLPERGNYPPVSWLEEEQWDGPVLADDARTTAFDALGGQSFPTIIAVNAEGKVTARYEGEADQSTFVALARSTLQR